MSEERGAGIGLLSEDYRCGFAHGLKTAVRLIDTSEALNGSSERTRALRLALESIVPEEHRNPGSGEPSVIVTSSDPKPPDGYVVGKCPPGASCLACDRLGYHYTPAEPNAVRPRAKVPDWMERSVEDYGAAVERLVLAFVRKHGERPKLFTDDRPDLGQMAAFCHPRFVADDGEGVHPKLAELAAAHADEWHERYGDLDPDEAIAYMIASPGEVRVRVERRTPEVEEALAKRSEYVRTLLAAARNPGH